MLPHVYFKRVHVRSIGNSKAFHFLLIQASAFLAAVVIMHGIGAGGATAVGFAAAIALSVSLWRRSEWWWHMIHAGFPIAVTGLMRVDLPSHFFLVGFLLLAGFNWHTVRNRVPYFPSGRVTWDAVAECLPQSHRFSFVDIGSGLGGLNFHLAKRFAGSRFVGVEISPIPWLISRVRSVLTGQRCSFLRKDYNALDLGQFDVVFAYLSPAVMPELWAKARREMRPGSMLLSFEFEVPGVSPDAVAPAGMGGRPLYCWRINS